MLKHELRIAFRKKRNEILPDKLHEYSMRIGQILISWLLENSDIKCVHSFLPARKKGEIDTRTILSLASEKLPYLKFVVPKVLATPRNLSHHAWKPETPLTVNKWGIPEPETSEPLDTNRIDAVLVPMLIFDRDGHRVGYGGGYYDTFLADVGAAVRKIGLCIFEPVDAISDIGPYDIRLDQCITPEKIYNFF